MTNLRTFVFAASFLWITLFNVKAEEYSSSKKEKSTKEVTMTVTAYCPCQKCCGWKRNANNIPVYANGLSKGKPKKVGYTASGTKAQKGTVAADLRKFPFGTRLYIPGYGYAKVEDRGKDIVGNRLDIFFPTHSQALKWGKRKIKVTVNPLLKIQNHSISKISKTSNNPLKIDYATAMENRKKRIKTVILKKINKFPSFFLIPSIDKICVARKNAPQNPTENKTFWQSILNCYVISFRRNGNFLL